MPFPFGALIGAVGSLVGSSISSKSNASATAAANRANIAAQKKINQKNIKAQMEVNKNQIQWLVRDAQKAGIHPLAALGSSVAGNIAAPIMSAPTIQARSGDTVGTGIAAASAMVGQGIDTWLARQNTALQNEALMLQNAQSRTMIAQSRAAVNGAPVLQAFGLPLQRNAGLFASGQDVQNEYGEPGEWVIGAPSLAESFGRALSTKEGQTKALSGMGFPASVSNFLTSDPKSAVLQAIDYALSVYASQLVPHSNHAKGR